jgi:16S rRNA A1518/A1519 N6-dimethyltransferase RsmA/KsgA/DIM1 with predicted DNA glycosylase/AP lyase activity
MTSLISHSIKHRKNAKDIFYTPELVAKTHISLIKQDGLWLDAFKGKGVYYDNFPYKKDWCEIIDGKDFFDYNICPDVIISNPPYSILDKVFKKSIELNPTIISYLLLHGSMTPRRIKMFNDAGYGLTSIYITKVFKWYGMTEAYTFEKGKPNIATITYDRIVHR